jgi:translation elongation factor EF-Tu-like GTPase
MSDYDRLQIRVDRALETLDDLSDTASCAHEISDVVSDLWATYEATREDSPCVECGQWKSIAFRHLNHIMELEEKLGEYETREAEQYQADFTEQIKGLFNGGQH